MPNKGAVSSNLNAGGSYTIPAGYHNGSGKVTANTLASMTSAADAAAGQILKGKKAYVDGTLVTGTMPDNTTLTSNGTVPGINSTYASIPTREGSGLQYGKDTAGTARISLCPPEGYYQGGSASYVNRPAADFGNAATNQVISGATFTSSNGLKLTGTVSVQSVLSFNAAPYSTTQITFTWKNPAKGAFSGVIIVGKTGSSPTSVSDGTRWYKGSGNNTSPSGTSSVTIGGFAIGTTYYFRAYAYAVKDNAEWVGGSLTANAKTTAKGSQTFTSSGTFTVPAAVRTIDIFVVGGGGSGGHCNGYSSQGNKTNAGGAGGGYTATKKAYAVTPGQTFAVTVGAGGPYTSGSSATGGTTSFGSILSANGGNGGQGGRVAGSVKGGDGGSGGGGAGGSGSYATYAKGGSDGSDGVTGKSGTPGKGQGTTTRAFGESSNTLYAGGGGGYNSSSSGGGGAGGDGGGGAARTNGTANTGGGGGASGYKGSSYAAGAGGSGVCIVRWGY